MGRSRTIELLRDVDDLPSDDRQFVAALERGLRVLRMFSSAHETLSNGELYCLFFCSPSVPVRRLLRPRASTLCSQRSPSRPPVGRSRCRRDRDC